MKKLLLLISLVLAIFCSNAQVTVNILPSKDNSIFSESGTISNGLGKLYSGQNNSGDLRRALIYFDIAANVPAGATITNVTLSLEQEDSGPSATNDNYDLHAITQDWGEGTSSGAGAGAPAIAPDATWTDAMFGTVSWTNPGGDFLVSVATTTVDNTPGIYTWSSADMITNAQAWLDNPASNFGWMLIGNEATVGTARRFGSKDQGTAPTLQVEYTCSNSPTAICEGQILYLNATGDSTLLDADFDGGSFSNCGGNLTYAASQTTFDCSNVQGATLPDGLVLSAVFDAGLTGGLPKGIELYTYNYIPDLSEYGIGSANNGGGSAGVEFTFPQVEVPAGTYIYVSSEATEFQNFFGFAPDYVSGSVNINGDDAIELFKNGTVIDVFGDINVDGSGQPWEYMDGWAYRVSSTGPDGTTFTIGNWSFSGINALDNETSNATATTPVPVKTYSQASSYGTDITLTITDDFSNTNTCTANIVVFDTVSPQANCFSNPTFNLDATGNLALTPADLDSLSSDACGISTMTLSQTNFSCADVGVLPLTLFVEDNNGNTNSCISTITIDGSAAISIDNTTVTDASCFGTCDGTIDISGTNIASYSIDGGLNFQSSGTFSALCADVYDIVVDNGSGCTSTAQEIVSEPTEVTFATISTDVSCFGAADGEIQITATGGNSSYEYSIDNGNIFVSTSDFTSLPPGTYSIVVRDLEGCQSSAQTVIITQPTPVDVSTSVSGITITATGTGMNYQWMECPGYSVIFGETDQSFTPIVNGDYAVEVTDADGCTDTSDCVTINDLSVSDFDLNSLKLYPNPASEELTIEFRGKIEGFTFLLLNAQGAIVREGKLDQNISSVKLNNLENGVYFVRIKGTNSLYTRRVIIQ